MSETLEQQLRGQADEWAEHAAVRMRLARDEADETGEAWQLATAEAYKRCADRLRELADIAAGGGA